jgi:uncharacterized protein (TIGR03435 family)
MKERDKEMKAVFDQSFPVPSQEQTDATCERVFERLNSADVEFAGEGTNLSRPWWRLTSLRVVAAAFVGIAVLALPFVKTVLMPESAYATAELSEGMVYRVSEGKSRAIAVGEQIAAGTVVRTDEKSAVLALPDGALIEMQPKSELSLEQAKDGVKINLSNGSARVTPAKEPAMNLYLQNKEEVVSVVAEVFRSATLPQRQSLPEPDATFEEVSIRPSPPLQGGVGLRQGGPGGAAAGPSLSGCPATQFELNPGRFVATRITLSGLVSLAYGDRCLSQETFVGGPDWIRTQLFDVQALIPAGTPPATRTDLRDGKAPWLRKMIQNMLATRFKLSVRREMREMSVYNLILTKPEKLVPAGDPEVTTAHFREVRQSRPMVGTGNMTLTEFAAVLQGQTGRPVIDRTNVNGRYDFLIILSDELPSPPPPVDASREVQVQSLNRLRDSIVSRLEGQVGLKLEPSRAQVEVIVVERAEKPSEN